MDSQIKLNNSKFGKESTIEELTSELLNKLKIEEFISEVSTRFIIARWDKIEIEIDDALKKIAEYIGFDRCSISEINDVGDDFIMTHQYAKPGIPAIKLSPFKTTFPWMIDKLLKGETVVANNMDQLPPEAFHEKDVALKFGIKSSIQMPLKIGETIVGLLSIGSHDEMFQPLVALGKFQTVLSDLFGNVLARKRRELEIDTLRNRLSEKLQFEEIISGLSSRFIHIPWKKIDSEIENSLKDVVDFLKFERGNILEINEMGDDVIVTHQYPGTASRETGFKDIVPWYIDQMLKGKTILISSPNDFPPEAVQEIELSKQSRFESTITLPLLDGDKIIGAVGFTTYSFDVKWNQDIVHRLMFLSNIYANAISRKKNEEKLEKFNEQVQTENIILKEDLKNEYDFENIIGNSDVIKYVFYKIKQIAPTNMSVLIEGETGVGKQLFAYAIHQMSQRKHVPLLKVNCAALPANLIESELFGHEKGAFTGADKSVKGRFEIADGGTIFLDEIGEMPLELQSKLLRVLQDGEFERLGNPKTIKSDVRIIAATNRKLKEEIAAGKFRKDLYYRLSTYPITIPPLRERKDDILLLVNYYVNKFGTEMGKKVQSISKNTMDKLKNYSWPGNVRELENILERGVVTMKGSVLNITDELDIQPTVVEQITTLEDMERNYIIKVLEITEGKIYGEGGAAEILGMNPSTLRARIKKLSISSKKIHS